MNNVVEKLHQWPLSYLPHKFHATLLGDEMFDEVKAQEKTHLNRKHKHIFHWDTDSKDVIDNLKIGTQLEQNIF